MGHGFSSLTNIIAYFLLRNFSTYFSKFSMTNLSSIRDRVLGYLLLKGISKYCFYQKTGLSNGFLDKAGSITSDNCEKICYAYPDLDPEWLLTGKGNMLRTYDRLDEENVEKSLSVETLVQKIVELSSENTLLKKENENLKKKIVGYKPLSEEDLKDNIAAEPRI